MNTLFPTCCIFFFIVIVRGIDDMERTHCFLTRAYIRRCMAMRLEVGKSCGWKMAFVEGLASAQLVTLRVISWALPQVNNWALGVYVFTMKSAV